MEKIRESENEAGELETDEPLFINSLINLN